LKIYKTYDDKSVLVAAVCDPHSEETLSYKAIISLLRLGRLFISRTKLKTFPLPFKSLYWQTHIYNGYVKRLIISHKIYNKHKHVQEDKRWGKVYTKWAKVRNCIKKCGTNPASNEPIPLSAVPILYDGDTSDLLAELRANFVQAAMYRYPPVVTGTGTHFPVM